MNCALLDFRCHAQSAAWQWWESLGWQIQALYIAGSIAVLVGISWSFLSLLKRIGGWPAVGGAITLIIATVLAFLPRKPSHNTVEVDDEDPPVRRTKPARKKPTSKTRTIFDMFGKR